MNVVLPDHLFPLTAVDGPAHHLTRIVDATCGEVQGASNVERAAEDRVTALRCHRVS